MGLWPSSQRFRSSSAISSTSSMRFTENLGPSKDTRLSGGRILSNSRYFSRLYLIWASIASRLAFESFADQLKFAGVRQMDCSCKKNSIFTFKVRAICNKTEGLGHVFPLSYLAMAVWDSPICWASSLIVSPEAILACRILCPSIYLTPRFPVYCFFKIL